MEVEREWAEVVDRMEAPLQECMGEDTEVYQVERREEVQSLQALEEQESLWTSTDNKEDVLEALSATIATKMGTSLVTAPVLLPARIVTISGECSRS